MNKPLLVIVTGRPGSGKTTLAHALAREICCPVFCRDEFKEGLCVTEQKKHTELPPDTNGKVYEVFFRAVELVLQARMSLVAEAAFQHKLWAPKLTPLLEFADIRIVVCSVDSHAARSRFIERGLANPRREQFHRDTAVHAAKEGIALLVGNYDPPRLPVPTLHVDTTNGYQPDMASILTFVRQPGELSQ